MTSNNKLNTGMLNRGMNVRDNNCMGVCIVRGGKSMGELVSAPCINGGGTLSWETFVRDSTNTVIVV